MMKKSTLFCLLFLLCNLAFSTTAKVYAGDIDPVIFLWLMFFIFISRSLSIVKKIGIPIVVGEIIAGIVMDQMHYFGFNLFQNTESNIIIKFLAELGAIILMFEIGIESKFSDLTKHFSGAIGVATVGSVITFITGFLISYFLIPNSSLFLNLLIGTIASCTATGISAKVFKDLRILNTKEVKIILTASIIDEIISIFAFAIVSSIIIDQTINLSNLSFSIFQVIGFFIFAFIFGQWVTPIITTFSTKIDAGLNMKIGVLLVFCFLFAWTAHEMGIATVVGAFVGGLILDQVYFNSFSNSNFFTKLKIFANRIDNLEMRHSLKILVDTQEKRSLEELLKPLSHFFVPVFFIYIGFILDIKALFKFDVLIITVVLLFVSFAGRILSGFFAKGSGLNKSLIGLGMTPIGEAGLIFAIFGNNLGIINMTVMSAIVSTLVISSIIAPILIKISIKMKGFTHEEHSKSS